MYQTFNLAKVFLMYLCFVSLTYIMVRYFPSSCVDLFVLSTCVGFLITHNFFQHFPNTSMAKHRQLSSFIYDHHESRFHHLQQERKCRMGCRKLYSYNLLLIFHLINKFNFKFNGGGPSRSRPLPPAQAAEGLQPQPPVSPHPTPPLRRRRRKLPG